jgi:hypothetical protein
MRLKFGSEEAIMNVSGFVLPGILFAVIGTAAWHLDSTATEPTTRNVDDDLAPTLMFDIKAVKVPAGKRNTTLFDCTYSARGKTAKFQMQFTVQAQAKGEAGMTAAEGSFLSVAGSDNSVLLEDLKKTLQATQLAKNSIRTKESRFDAAILGTKQSRSDDDEFFRTPPGDWTAMKIFLPKGGDDGEMFLNFNTAQGRAEFSMKDEEYSDYLVEALSKVL